MPREVLPNKVKWSLRAVARHLLCDRATVSFYAIQIAPVIPDYRAECPRNPDGSIKSGFALSPYQCWVVCQVVKLARTLKDDLNGTAYRKQVKAVVVARAHLLSKAAWLEIEQSA